MSILTCDKYTHYIDGVQVFPSGDWEIVHEWPEGCIFSRREFSGELTFGNIAHNGLSDDYDYLMGLGDCQRVDYDIYCNGELYWEGYINHTIGYEVDEDNCTIKVTPLLSDEYDCILLYSDVEYADELSTISFENVVVYQGTGDCPYSVDDTIPACLKLNDMINDLIKSAYFMGCGFTGDIVSSFFWADDYPDGTGVVNNYVTGAANPWDEVLLASISKARIAFGSTEAENVYPENTTFNTLMQMLRDFFEVYWYIDSNGDFRLEHLHYFEHDFADRDHTNLPDDIDLTAIINEYTGKPLSTYKNKYKALEANMPSQEKLTMTAAEGEDFIGLPILYDLDCTYNYPKVVIKEYDNSMFMTDVQMIVDDPDSVSSEGWLVLCGYEADLHVDDNMITGWANNANPNDWDTFVSAGANITNATHAATPPTGVAYTNALGGVLVGDKFTLCYQVNGAFAGSPFVGIYDATLGGNLVSNTAILNGDGNVHTITFTITALAAQTYLRLQTNNPGGDTVQNATFSMDDYDEVWLCHWETGAISAALANNGHFSTANLMDNYWRHGRVLEEGTMNDAAETFDSVKPNSLQVQIVIPRCCEKILWGRYYTTGLGTGKLYSAKEKKYTHEIELVYDGT